MLTALINRPSSRLSECELTFIKRQPIDFVHALEQHQAYAHALESCGARVNSLAVNAAYADSAFIEDTAVVLDEVATISSMGAVSRRGEIESIASELLRYRMLQRIEPPATLEGGDVTRVGRILFVGRSQRTNEAGIDSLRRFVEPFAYRVIPLEARGCLHLKSACTAIDDTAVLANPSWLESHAIECLNAAKIEIVAVAPEELAAANVLSLPGGTILSAAHPRTAEILTRRGMNVCPVDLSEFAKAEACATCLSLVFETHDSILTR